MSQIIRTGLIGHPVKHSKSPVLHCHWLKKYNINGTYDLHDTTPEELETKIRTLTDQNYTGFNVTIPYKESIFNLCDTLDDLACTVGAVNTVTVQNGKLHGTNTDVFGFIENFKIETQDFDLTKGPAVILGAGGAAKAVIHGLLIEGVQQIRLLNRTKDKAEALREQTLYPKKISIIEWNKRNDALRDAHVLINTTALGMQGYPDLDISLKHLPPGAAVSDIVYNPLDTGLLQCAKENGYITAPGIGMLIHQARKAFELWHGLLPDVDDSLVRQVTP